MKQIGTVLLILIAAIFVLRVLVHLGRDSESPDIEGVARLGWAFVSAIEDLTYRWVSPAVTTVGDAIETVTSSRAR